MRLFAMPKAWAKIEKQIGQRQRARGEGAEGYVQYVTLKKRSRGACENEAEAKPFACSVARRNM
jgi:hypothetical protein